MQSYWLLVFLDLKHKYLNISIKYVLSQLLKLVFLMISNLSWTLLQEGKIPHFKASR